MGTEEHKTLFRRFNEEVINKRNLAAIDTFMAPDFVEHEVLPPGTPPGREGAKVLIAGLLDAFPDLQVTVDQELADGDRVMFYETWRGTHQGEFFGIPPSGQPVTFKVIDIVRVANGKVVEHWAVSDNLSLMQQLGAIPAPGQAG